MILMSCNLQTPEIKVNVEQSYEIYYNNLLQNHIATNNKFKLALGKRESNNNEFAINTIGAIGIWQFTTPTLATLGYKNITYKKFKLNPSIFPRALQEEVLEAKIDDWISEKQ